MKSEPTIDKIPISNQGISLCGSYGSQEFVKKIAERIGSPPSTLRQQSSEQRPLSAQITRKNANLLSPKFNDNKLTKYSQFKCQMKNKKLDSDKKNSYFLNIIDKQYHSKKNINHHNPPFHHIKSQKQSQDDHIDTPDQDEQELLIIDENQPPMKRAYHRPFSFKVPMKSQFQEIDHHPGGKGGLGKITFFSLNQTDQQKKMMKMGRVDLNQERQRINRNTISNFKNSMQKIRLKSLQGMKANIHQKMMLKGSRSNINKAKQPQRQSMNSQIGIPLNFQLKAINYPIKVQTGKTSIRCCTPEQIFKQHTDSAISSKSITQFIQNSSNIRSTSEIPFFSQIIKQNQLGQTIRQKTSNKKQPNSKAANKIERRKSSPNLKSRSLKDITTVKWKSSLDHWAPLNKPKSTQQLKQIQSEKIILQNKQIEAYYKKLIQQRNTAKQLLLSQQDEIQSRSQSPFNMREEFKLQSFRPEGGKATVFRLRKNSDFQRHLQQSLGLKRGNKKRERELVDGKNFLFKKYVPQNKNTLK